MNRPETTLFLLMSVDGKISTGAGDERDVDRDFPGIPGVCEGLGQYYDIEQTTALWSSNTGRVMAKVGMNERPLPKEKLPCSFVLLDNRPHLTAHGVAYLSAWLEWLVIVTADPAHPAYGAAAPNVTVIGQDPFDPAALFAQLYEAFGVRALTVQSGGTVNALLLRAGLIDRVDVVVAPVLVGGEDTPSLIGGASVRTAAELSQLRPLTLESCEALAHSYLRLRYRVQNERR